MLELTFDQWSLLSPYLDEALDMTNEQCHLWLSSMRTEDPVLADQLESLLRERRVIVDECFLEKAVVKLPCADI